MLEGALQARGQRKLHLNLRQGQRAQSEARTILPTVIFTREFQHTAKLVESTDPVYFKMGGQGGLRQIRRPEWNVSQIQKIRYTYLSVKEPKHHQQREQ